MWQAEQLLGFHIMAQPAPWESAFVFSFIREFHPNMCEAGE